MTTNVVNTISPEYIAGRLVIEQQCLQCGGAGNIRRYKAGTFYEDQFDAPCPACKGTGWVTANLRLVVKKGGEE